jgi:tRNA modification GTPase
MDLVQAEAVQDLIQSSSEESALSAVRSLTGEFSEKINQILSELIALRVFVEATIDFSDEEIDFLESHEVSSKLHSLKLTLLNILESANQGAILRDGIHVAIAGKPNAGKSSLLNSLTKQPSAIVTDVAGTTRDVLKETIQIDGMPIHIIDTAGLHNSDNIIEQEGIRRAHTEINNADVVLLVYDASDKSVDLSILPESVKDKPKIVIKNKIDLTGSKTGIQNIQNNPEISISAKNGDGINIVRKALADFAGLNSNTEGVFLARKRHIIAINETLSFINSAISQLDGGASELVAEDLRQAGMHLGQITGEFSSDDLLGQIFSSFCIGK